MESLAVGERGGGRDSHRGQRAKVQENERETSVLGFNATGNKGVALVY